MIDVKFSIKNPVSLLLVLYMLLEYNLTDNLWHNLICGYFQGGKTVINLGNFDLDDHLQWLEDHPHKASDCSLRGFIIDVC